jgi:dTDP-4-dehydrorhamnose reductase
VHVVILGSDTPLGVALVEQLETLARHELTLMTLATCRWKSERQAKKSIVRAQADICVDLRIEAAGYGRMQIQDTDLKRTHWVAKACQRTGTAYLYVSSSRVFSGELDRPYVETDVPDNPETIGQMLAEAEQLVQGCERHLVLRLGPVFSYEGANLITQLLGPLQEGDSLIMDNNLRGSPVAAADGARVISGLLDQIGTGFEPWGIYHYGSSDTATYYEFAEALLAAASQFSEFSSSAVQLEKESESMPPRNRTLECSKIRDVFAIRQLPWRSAIGDLVKYYFEQVVEEKSHGQVNG